MRFESSPRFFAALFPLFNASSVGSLPSFSGSAAVSSMQALGDLLQAICIFLEAPKDIIEVGLTTIIERTGGGGGAGEGIPYRLVLKFETQGSRRSLCYLQPENARPWATQAPVPIKA